MASQTRILIASVVRQHPDVFRAHVDCLLAQRLGKGVTADLLYVIDSDAEHRDALEGIVADIGASILWTGERPRDAHYDVSDFTHGWSEPTFAFLAREKQRILDFSVAHGFDGVFLVDSDLLCGSGTLQSLVDSQKPVVSAVFWTQWTPGEPEMPQVWQQHPYGFEAAGWTTHSFLAALREQRLLRVRGLGACTLIRKEALDAGAALWPLLEDLPHGGMWQGEDRHFCIRCERLHIDLWADAWPEVWHCYRPTQRAELEAHKTRLIASAEGAPLPGDLISASVEVLDVPQLFGHKEPLRGRLDSLSVLPAIRETLATLSPGGSAFVETAYPPHWMTRAGELATFRVTLHDVRPS